LPDPYASAILGVKSQGDVYLMDTKRCVLEDRNCNDCGECLFCDLNPIKVCDNCGECIATDADYLAIAIDAIILPGKGPGNKPGSNKKDKDPDKDKK
jgi:hypothetical protein